MNSTASRLAAISLNPGDISQLGLGRTRSSSPQRPRNGNDPDFAETGGFRARGDRLSGIDESRRNSVASSPGSALRGMTAERPGFDGESPTSPLAIRPTLNSNPVQPIPNSPPPSYEYSEALVHQNQRAVSGVVTAIAIPDLHAPPTRDRRRSASPASTNDETASSSPPTSRLSPRASSPTGLVLLPADDESEHDAEFAYPQPSSSSSPLAHPSSSSQSCARPPSPTPSEIFDQYPQISSSPSSIKSLIQILDHSANSEMNENGRDKTFAKDLRITSWRIVGGKKWDEQTRGRVEANGTKDRDKAVKGRVGAYVVYEVEIDAKAGPKIVVLRRYTDFEVLREKLKRKFPNLRTTIGALPPKNSLSKFEPTYLDKRLIKLQFWLKTAMLHPVLGGSEEVRDWVLSR